MNRKRCWITTLFVFVVSIGFSQIQPFDSAKRFSFGFSFSPDYTYRTLKSDIDDMGFIDLRNETESARFGFTTGLTVKYRLSERLVLESGLQYADRGDKMELGKTYYFGEDGAEPIVSDNSKVVNHYYFLGIPLKANLFLVNKRTKVFLSTGISTDFFSGSKTKQTYTVDGIDEVTSYSEEGVDFNTVNFVGLAGLGIDYKVNQKLELRVEPIIRYSFSSLTTYSDVKTYLYSAGINLAVYFQK